MASDTHYPWLVDDADIIDGPKLPIRGGTMAVPKGPGLGVALDHDKLARAHEVYTQVRHARPRRRSPDAPARPELDRRIALKAEPDHETQQLLVELLPSDRLGRDDDR